MTAPVRLWVLCEHGYSIQHPLDMSGWTEATGPRPYVLVWCPGGRSPTTEELIGELERRGWMVPPLQNDYSKDSEELPKDPWDYDP